MKRKNETKQLRVFSYGGGIQSTAGLVLASKGILKYDAFLFCNVGDDSENPKTIEYMRDVAVPFASKHGIELIELKKRMRDGTVETLMDRLNKTQSSIPIPVRMSNGAPGNRPCTVDFKIKVVSKWMKENGATKSNPGLCGIGISVDEIHRMNSNSIAKHVIKEHPLIDLEMNRNDCIRVIRDAGVPVPPKSSCFFCPFHRMGEWQRMKREQPELFAKVVEVENMINVKRIRGGRDKVWMTRFAKPLVDVVDIAQEELKFGALDVCESGFCML